MGSRSVRLRQAPRVPVRASDPADVVLPRSDQSPEIGSHTPERWRGTWCCAGATRTGPTPASDAAARAVQRESCRSRTSGHKPTFTQAANQHEKRYPGGTGRGSGRAASRTALPSDQVLLAWSRGIFMLKTAYHQAGEATIDRIAT